jgi:hypothetical protein
VPGWGGGWMEYLQYGISDGKPAIKLTLHCLGMMHSKNLMIMANQI